LNSPGFQSIATYISTRDCDKLTELIVNSCQNTLFNSLAGINLLDLSITRMYLAIGEIRSKDRVAHRSAMMLDRINFFNPIANIIEIDIPISDIAKFSGDHPFGGDDSDVGIFRSE
jgi:hypothetical protein